MGVPDFSFYLLGLRGAHTHIYIYRPTYNIVKGATVTMFADNPRVEGADVSGRADAADFLGGRSRRNY